MARDTTAAPIQTFNLFGELADLPDVVHCETIAYRSRRHNWELDAHRHARLHQVLLITSGGGRVTFDGQAHAFGPAQAINIPVGVVHGFTFAPETEGWVVTLATEVLDHVLEDAEGLARVLDRPAVLAEATELEPYVARLQAEYTAKDFARAQVLRALCGLVLGLVARRLQAIQPDPAEAPRLALYRRFQDLVNAHFTDHWPVARYAAALNCTPGHLSRICRQAAGTPAHAVITERLIREARRLLTYTNLTVAQVAYELGYIDPAYFSRVFAREAGASPRVFRRGAARVACS